MPHCRIFFQQPLSCQSSVSIPEDMAHYLRHVMRLHEGDFLTVFDGHGGEYQAQIEQLSKQHASCFTTSFDNISRELAMPIHIIQCANKSEKIETVLQKGTELGAASFHITNSQRSVLKLSGVKLEKRLARWQRIIIEAAEQSERTAIPALYWHPRLSDVPSFDLGYALHPHQSTSWQKLRKHLCQAQSIAYAVGPEGGWSDDDLSILHDKGFQSMMFGLRIMRTETAAPALLAATQALLD
ncbi:MAG: 16S rRNA (uracil(1498)-N(3))-methyltransferase [Mariprofundaceae bacterium]|nr:16S rRNA (uracil(1498)-N(3))-methyltransferase [Mariprofundaceae bacterium]